MHSHGWKNVSLVSNYRHPEMKRKIGIVWHHTQNIMRVFKYLAPKYSDYTDRWTMMTVVCKSINALVLPAVV